MIAVVPQPQVERLTSENTSTDQHLRAWIRSREHHLPLDLPLSLIFPGRSAAVAMILAGGREWADAVERIAETVFFYLQVVAGLQVDPEPLRGAEETG
jgi:hypothetical protein